MSDEPILRLRPDFPQRHRLRRSYFLENGLTDSDLHLFEHVLRHTVNDREHHPSAQMSIHAIVAGTGLSRSTVIRSLKRLREAGFLDVARDPEWRRHRESSVGVARSLLVAAETGVTERSSDTSCGLKPGLYNVDCFDAMRRIQDGSIDLVLTDLPHNGLTQNDWDLEIDVPALWIEYRRIIKPGGAVVLTAASPFDKVLAMSNIGWLKHEWVWVKTVSSGFLSAKYAPLRAHETVLVFCSGTPVYHPQMVDGTPYRVSRKPTASPNYKGSSRSTVTVNNGTRYPTTVLTFKRDDNPHSTGKPVALFEYLIRTYSNPGDLVLDTCMGSGTAAVACIASKRRFIGMERNPAIFFTAVERVNAFRGR